MGVFVPPEPVGLAVDWAADMENGLIAGPHIERDPGSSTCDGVDRPQRGGDPFTVSQGIDHFPAALLTKNRVLGVETMSDLL